MKNRFILCIAIIGASLVSLHAAQVSTTDSGQKTAASETQSPVQLAEALIKAIKENNEAAVEALLQQGAQPATVIGQVNGWLATPLLMAVRLPAKNSIIQKLVNADKRHALSLLLADIKANQYAEIHKLLAGGTDANTIFNRAGALSTPLGEAVSKGDQVTVQLLLNAKANPNLSVAHGHSPLFLAVYSYNLPIAKLLIKAGANINARQEDDLTPLMEAVDRSDLEMTELLAQAGAHLDAQTTDKAPEPYQEGDTPLIMAAKSGDYELVKTLLNYRANPTIANNAGKTVYDYAQTNPIMQKVISQFAKLGSPEQRKTQQQVAQKAFEAGMKKSGKTVTASEDIAEVVQGFLRPAPEQTTGRLISPALQKQAVTSSAKFKVNAALNNEFFGDLVEDADRKEAVSILLGNKQGEIPDVVNYRNEIPRLEGNTFLMNAVEDLELDSTFPNPRIIQQLIALGSPINEQNKQGKTALMIMINNGQRDDFPTQRIVNILKKAGANLNAQDNDGNTALILSAQKNLPLVAYDLLRWGANPRLANKKDKTFFDYAKNNPTMQWMLEQARTEQKTKQKIFKSVAQKALEGQLLSAPDLSSEQQAALLQKVGGQMQQLSGEVQKFLTPTTLVQQPKRTREVDADSEPSRESKKRTEA